MLRSATTISRSVNLMIEKSLIYSNDLEDGFVPAQDKLGLNSVNFRQGDTTFMNLR